MPDLSDYFVGEDAFGDLCVWRGRESHTPQLVMTQRDLRDDPPLWEAIVALLTPAETS